MRELRAATAAALQGEVFAATRAAAVARLQPVPAVDVFQPDGYTKEEDKLPFETRRSWSAASAGRRDVRQGAGRALPAASR